MSPRLICPRSFAPNTLPIWSISSTIWHRRRLKASRHSGEFHFHRRCSIWWQFRQFNGVRRRSFCRDFSTDIVASLDVTINEKSIAPQSEITVPCGSRITIDINISNNQATPLQNLILSVQFYQDYQNGMQNYRLETRTCTSGPN